MGVAFESNASLPAWQTPNRMPETTFETSIGTCGLVWHEAGLTAFRLPDDATSWEPPARAEEIPAWIQSIITRVQCHLAGEWQDFSDLNYDFSATSDFTCQVYDATLQIKPGATCSYGDIAQTLNRPPGTSRAVGTALGANPWPLLIPCHRVIASNGKMTGFSGPGGIKTKLRLLALEGAQLFAE